MVPEFAFTERHEVRQVYVRSTARVYEIYHVTDGQNDNDYLCTVRCGVAEREGEVLLAGDEAVELLDSHGKTTESPQDISRSNNSSISDEDGWVDVKVTDSSLSGTDSTDRNVKRTIQDYYEATAEITDSSPCISITLRLLSLQVKESLHIEEIYIFADPAEPIDSPKSQNSTGTGSNVLAMLVPSLLQLSQSRRDKIQEKHDHDFREGQMFGDRGSRPIASISPEAKTAQQGISSTVQQETCSKAADAGVLTRQSPNSDASESGDSGSRGQVPSVENMQGSISGQKDSHIERMLDHLDSRMGRIEAFCARLEENMLKPLNCMATRLDQLEQKLDALVARSHPSTSCMRFVAPEFSVGESESNDNTRSPAYDASESVQKGISDPSYKRQFSSDDDASTLAEPAPELRPCLVVTAPEFSTDDNDAEKSWDESFESVRKDLIAPEFFDVNNSNEKCDDTAASATNDGDAKKPSLSIDDALASALSAFISSASTQIPKLSATLQVKAPDFAIEDDDSEESPSSPLTGGSKDPNISCCVSQGLESLETTAFIPTSKESNVCMEGDLKYPQEAVAEAMRSTMFSADPDMRHTDYSSTEKSATEAANVDRQKRDGTENSNTETSSDETVIFGDKSSSDAMQGGSPDEEDEGWKDAGDGDSTIGIQHGDEGDDKLSRTSKSALDFSIPILDVKFAKQEDGSHRLPLEKLLWEEQEREIGGPVGKDNYDDSDATCKQNHLVWIEINQSLELEDTFMEHADSCYELKDAKDNSKQESFSGLI
ncbi:hypothetical protein ACLOJK_016063 [Asimina triloba]